MKNFLAASFLVSTSVFAAPVNPAIVDAIINDLEGLVGDTVNEGSWSAYVKRDASGRPTDVHCKSLPPRSQKAVYSCDITFLVTPNEGEDLGEDPWEATCTDVQYTSRATGAVPPPSARVKKAIVARVENTVHRCLETLSESP